MAKTMKAARFRKGEVIGGQFEVVRKLGEGGCGAVYRCRDSKRGGSDVAVKVLEDASELQRFRREARVMRATDSEHVVRYHGKGRHEALSYLVMEFADGGSVKNLIDRRGKLAPNDAAWILIQAIRGLKRAGTVHRDLKPENLLLVKGSIGRGLELKPGDNDGGVTVKVADFGLAKSPDANSLSLTQSGQVMGTPVYMSPEQCRNTKRVSVRSDIYSLGVMLYELVTGRVPFDANNIYDIMEAHCNQEPRLGHLPKEVRAICERCLQKEPGKRYPSLAALERDLSHLAGLSFRGGGGGSGVWFVIITVLVLTGLAAAVFFFRHDLLEFYRQLTG